MRATTVRDIFTTQSTTSIFTIYNDNESVFFQCFLLEDVARAESVKIPHETCIPEGHYKLGINQSQRFGRLMPIIYNQPDLQ